jgi:hypothetical protein
MFLCVNGIDPSFVITHRVKLEEAPAGYQIFSDQKGDIKIVLKTLGRARHRRILDACSPNDVNRGLVLVAPILAGLALLQ